MEVAPVLDAVWSVTPDLRACCSYETERHFGWRSKDLGAATIKGLRNWRWTCLVLVVGLLGVVGVVLVVFRRFWLMMDWIERERGWMEKTAWDS